VREKEEGDGRGEEGRGSEEKRERGEGRRKPNFFSPSLPIRSSRWSAQTWITWWIPFYTILGIFPNSEKV
jgi:hypothetical protein